VNDNNNDNNNEMNDNDNLNNNNDNNNDKKIKVSFDEYEKISAYICSWIKEREKQDIHSTLEEIQNAVIQYKIENGFLMDEEESQK